MQKFKNTQEAIGKNLGQYDEVLDAKSLQDAEKAARELDTSHTEANVIQVGEKYKIGLRSR